MKCNFYIATSGFSTLGRRMDGLEFGVEYGRWTQLGEKLR
jgi:hypothetical protein